MSSNRCHALHRKAFLLLCSSVQCRNVGPHHLWATIISGTQPRLRCWCIPMCPRAAPEADNINFAQHSCLLETSVKLRLGQGRRREHEQGASEAPLTVPMLLFELLQGSVKQRLGQTIKNCTSGNSC